MIRRWSIRSVAILAIAGTVAVLAVDTAKGWWMGPYQTFIVSLNALVGWVFIGAGWLIAERRPGNLVGPLLLAYGVVWAAAAPLDLYASLPARQVHGGLVVFFLRAISATLSVLFIMALLVFPDGRLPSRRWRIVVVIAIVGAFLGLAGWALGIRPINPAFPRYLSPLAIRGFDRATLIALSEWLTDLATWSIVLAFVVRWRRANAVERAQLKWVIAATALLGAITVVENSNAVLHDEFAAYTGIVVEIATGLVAVAIAVAIIRYRLFEIDRLVSRTIAYVIVSGILLATYAAVIITLQGPVLGPLTGGETIPVALSTLAVAALFGPLRRGVQHVVDRRFDRARFDAERTAAAFSDRLRDDVDIDSVTADLRTTVGGAVRPTRMAVWLRPAAE
jgi:hypothetical protein